jgi:FkbM family methyltransferase
VIFNRFNWLALFRAFWVFIDPFQFLVGLLRCRAPETVHVRTPVGRVTLTLRNVESLKTLFSIFCRQDYYTSQEKPYLFLDIGANIGLASAYFLSRNANNIVQSFEPDLTNLDYLRRNLAAFPGRAAIIDHAVAARSGVTVLYRSEDGKHSSLSRSERAHIPHGQCRPVLTMVRGLGSFALAACNETASISRRLPVLTYRRPIVHCPLSSTDE